MEVVWYSIDKKLYGVFAAYRIYANKRRGAYVNLKNFRASNATLIRGRCLFKNWPLR